MVKPNHNCMSVPSSSSRNPPTSRFPRNKNLALSIASQLKPPGSFIPRKDSSVETGCLALPRSLVIDGVPADIFHRTLVGARPTTCLDETSRCNLQVEGTGPSE